MIPSIRNLIAQAISEAGADYSRIVEAKLNALMGDSPAAATVKLSTATTKTSSSSTTAPPKRGPGRPKGSKTTVATTSAKRGPGRPKGSKNTTSAAKAKPKAIALKKKAAPKQAAKSLVPKSALVSSILTALSAGPMQKTPLMQAAEIDKRDSDRVKDVLKELRTAGKVVMSGEKNRAVYALTATAS